MVYVPAGTTTFGVHSQFAFGTPPCPGVPRICHGPYILPLLCIKPTVPGRAPRPWFQWYVLTSSPT